MVFGASRHAEEAMNEPARNEKVPLVEPPPREARRPEEVPRETPGNCREKPRRLRRGSRRRRRLKPRLNRRRPSPRRKPADEASAPFSAASAEVGKVVRAAAAARVAHRRLRQRFDRHRRCHEKARRLPNVCSSCLNAARTEHSSMRQSRGRTRRRIRADISRGFTSPWDAYRAYNQALRVSAGREVGIWYNLATGEYAVEIGTEVKVHEPQGEPRGESWVALVHFHPRRSLALSFRLPAPVTDFASLWARLHAGNETSVREFVEFDVDFNIPFEGHGRGSTEYGIDLAFPKTPLYIGIRHPNGDVDEPMRFASDAEYLKYYDSLAKWIEPRFARTQTGRARTDCSQ